MAGTDRMELYLTVNAAGDQMMLVSLFDNLGKGSSGAAVQCMNLMLGLPETEGWNKKLPSSAHGVRIHLPQRGRLLQLMVTQRLPP